ncbi:hypothetical protein BDB01DRAFT_339139 [Pilobolus umbonatus]|nr:hypothetical protein BDB01DRAFT_339139 [Pilobolus umbonatus]
MIMDDINLTLSQIDSVPSKSGISDTRSIDQNKRLSISQSSKRKEPEDDHVMTEIPIHTTDDKDTQGHVEQVDHLTIPDTASQNMETMSIQNMETTSIHSNIDTHKEDTNLEDSSAMNMEMVRQDREEATVEGDKELVTMDTANENIQGNFDQSNQNHSIDISMDMPDMEYNDYGHQSQSIVEGGDPNETDMAIQSMVDEIRQRMIDNRDQKKRKTMVLAVLHIEVFKSIINKVMKNIKRTSTHHTTNQSIEEYFKYTTEELDRQLQLYSNFQLYSNRNSRLTKLSTEYRTILFENEKSIEKTMKKSREIMMIQQQQKQKLEVKVDLTRSKLCTHPFLY